MRRAAGVAEGQRRAPQGPEAAPPRPGRRRQADLGGRPPQALAGARGGGRGLSERGQVRRVRAFVCAGVGRVQPGGHAAGPGPRRGLAEGARCVELVVVDVALAADDGVGGAGGVGALRGVGRHAPHRGALPPDVQDAAAARAGARGALGALAERDQDPAPHGAGRRGGHLRRQVEGAPRGGQEAALRDGAAGQPQPRDGPQGPHQRDHAAVPPAPPLPRPLPGCRRVAGALPRRQRVHARRESGAILY
mmetsp:Transcript_58279/g.142965  ORF Transcript_58279/g.142965 Transcript_58279/m.142965 type:complete len:249 (+) Transcript_58279:591-1337(+)